MSELTPAQEALLEETAAVLAHAIARLGAKVIRELVDDLTSAQQDQAESDADAAARAKFGDG